MSRFHIDLVGLWVFKLFSAKKVCREWLKTHFSSRASIVKMFFPSWTVCLSKKVFWWIVTCRTHLLNMSEKRIGIWILPFSLRMCPWPLKPLPIMTIKSGRGTSLWLKFFSIPRAYSTKDGVAIIHFSCNLDTLNHLDWVLQQNSIGDQTRAACECKRVLYPFVPSGMTIEACLIESKVRSKALRSTTWKKSSCP